MLKLTDKSILKGILIVFHIFRMLRGGNILPKKKDSNQTSRDENTTVKK